MIFYLLAFILIAGIGFGLFKAAGLKDIRITKSVTIKGSAEEVFNMVLYQQNFPKWSPFLAQDPSQKYEVKGIDGTVGVRYHWEGKAGQDLGYQEITKIEPLKSISMKCDIQKPFQANPVFDYSFSKTSEGIEVRQDFQLQSGLVDAFFLWAFGVKSKMEETNAQGLTLLKKAVENKL